MKKIDRFKNFKCFYSILVEKKANKMFFFYFACGDAIGLHFVKWQN